MASEIKIITKHPGDLEFWEYGSAIVYRPVGVDEYMVLHQTIPKDAPCWCPVSGTHDVCEDCSMWDEDKGCVNRTRLSAQFVETNLRRRIDDGYPCIESDGQVVVDITGHEPHTCAAHPDTGCLMCYGGCRQYHREEDE